MSIKKYLVAGPLGFGAAPLGNMFRDIPEQEALETVEAAWQQGTRYFDTAPFYGAGLSEIRLGKALAKHKRDDYILSTKVGRIISDEIDDSAKDFGEKTGLFEHGRQNKIIVDYTEKGTLEAIEGSLKRLGVDRIDFVWIHDVARDFWGDAWTEHFEVARKGAFKALHKMLEQKVIKGWGLGVNKVEPCELALDLNECRPNAFLLAGRYTLLDHSRALQRLMPAAAANDVGIVVGGPYSSGALVGGKHFEYQPAPPEILEKVRRIQALADKHGIPIKAAGLQFSLAHPAVAAVIPGASKPERLAEDHAALITVIPDQFWHDLRKENLVSPDAPLPVDQLNRKLATV